jgi:hypothetical protein
MRALKNSIQLEITNIENNILQRTADSVQHHVQLCLEGGGDFHYLM